MVAQLSLIGGENLERLTTYQRYNQLTKTWSKGENSDPNVKYYTREEGHSVLIVSDYIKTYNHEPVLAKCYFSCEVSYLYDENLLISYSFKEDIDLVKKLFWADKYYRSILGKMLIKVPSTNNTTAKK